MAETKQKPKTNKRVVSVLSALYWRQGTDPVTGDPVAAPIAARFGEEIDLTEQEENRLDSLDALLPAGAKPEDAYRHHEAKVDAFRAQRGDQEALQRHYERLREASSDDIVNVALDPRVLSVGELGEALKAAEVSADDTVALAQNDPQLAGKVLEAERLATDGKPRQQVEKRLREISGQ